MDENQNAAAQRDAARYRLLCDRLERNHSAAKRIYKKAKLSAAAAFLLITAAAVAVARRTGDPMAPLTVWIVLLFTLVFAFLAADYTAHLLSDGLLPFIRGETDDYPEPVLSEEDDGVKEEEEEEEDE